MKRILSVLIALIMVFCASVPAFAAVTKTRVTDPDGTTIAVFEKGLGVQHFPEVTTLEEADEALGMTTTAPEKLRGSKITGVTAEIDQCRMLTLTYGEEVFNVFLKKYTGPRSKVFTYPDPEKYDVYRDLKPSSKLVEFDERIYLDCYVYKKSGMVTDVYWNNPDDPEMRYRVHCDSGVDADLAHYCILHFH
ncbi:MAG: hypothetical protein IJ133_00695 [Clostridia bacterium]|nr:hypothetical protein [Clostridia bacterium]